MTVRPFGSLRTRPSSSHSLVGGTYGLGHAVKKKSAPAGRTVRNERRRRETGHSGLPPRTHDAAQKGTAICVSDAASTAGVSVATGASAAGALVLSVSEGGAES